MTNIVSFNAAHYFRKKNPDAPASRVQQVVAREQQMRDLRIGDKIDTDAGIAHIIGYIGEKPVASCNGIRITLPLT